MQIFDFHTHPGMQPGFDVTMTPELFVSEMQRAGVTGAAGSGLCYERIRPDTDFGAFMQEMNALSWSYHEQFPDFFQAGIHILGNHLETSMRELETYAAKGVRLVGELVPELMGCKTLLCPGFLELFARCQELGMVVNIHRTTIAECEEVAKQFPHLSVVMAHPGYMPAYEEVLEAVKRHDNLFFDLAGTGITAYGMLRYGIDKVGKDKILFGSDFPLNEGSYVGAVLYEKLTDEEREAVLYRNAQRFFQ